MTLPVHDFDGLFAAMAAAHSRTAAERGEDVVRLIIAGRRIDLRFAGRSGTDILLPALSHLVAQGDDGDADLTIAIWDSATSGFAPPRPDWSQAAIGQKGVIPTLCRPGGYAVFAHGAGVVQAYDVERTLAIYWTDDPASLPYWERSFPFRQILAWFFAPTSLLPAHAACVARDGRAVLLPGISGSGKSTTTLRLALEGFDLLGDDYVLLDATEPCRVWSLYGLTKLVPDALTLLPELVPHASRVRPTDEKTVVMWPTSAGGNLARCAQLHAILLPRRTHSGGASRLAPANAADVVFAIAPTTINHLDGPAAKVMRVARAFAAAAPAHYLHLGLGHDGLSDLVRSLLEPDQS